MKLSRGLGYFGGLGVVLASMLVVAKNTVEQDAPKPKPKYSIECFVENKLVMKGEVNMEFDLLNPSFLTTNGNGVVCRLSTFSITSRGSD